MCVGKRLGQNRETIRLHENEIIETLRSMRSGMRSIAAAGFDSDAIFLRRFIN